MKYAEFGSVSTSTLRTEDLLDEFARELEYQLSRNRTTRGLGKRAMRKLIREAWDAAKRDTVDGDDIVDELVDSLDVFAPPYAYFGAHPGDGSDFGYWPLIDELEEDALKVGDLDDVPADYTGDVMLVNVHGDVTYAVARKGRCKTIWSCV